MVRISNEKLLELLAGNSRMPYVKIAERLGVSETAVRKRVRKLEEEGIIEGYTIRVSPRRIGYAVQATIGIDTAPEAYIDVMEKLRGMDDVREMHSASGDHMLMAECWFRDPGGLAAFTRKLNAMKGVKKTCPAIIGERIK